MPRSNLARLLVALWLAACLALLAFAFIQRGVHDMPVAFAWLLIFLTFPIGLAAIMVVGPVWAWISTQLGVAYDPFVDLLPYWFVLVALGYMQWFVVLPMLWRRVVRSHVDAQPVAQPDARRRAFARASVAG
jgi:hypothetical protein